MKVPFQDDGPVNVPSAVFTDYLNFCHQKPDFDEIFYAWINENHPDHFRRLCIRDLLRQPYDKSEASKCRCCHTTTHGFGRLLHIDGGDKTDALRHILSYRPKLLDELTYEFLYVLNQNIVPQASIAKESRAELIELLLPLSSKPVGRTLWKHHPARSPSPIYSYYDIRARLRLWLPSAQYPNWLREELHSWLRTEIDAEYHAILERQTSLSQPQAPIFFDPEDDTPAILTLTEHCQIVRCSDHHPGTGARYEDQRRDATACLELLETLPSSFSYFSSCDVFIDLLPSLTDDSLIMRVARRHLIPAADDASFQHKFFTCFSTPLERYRLLAWLSTLCADLTPDDQKFLSALRTLRTQNRPSQT